MANLSSQNWLNSTAIAFCPCFRAIKASGIFPTCGIDLPAFPAEMLLHVCVKVMRNMGLEVVATI